MRFASAEDLVVLKMVAGRPRDIEDAVSVVAKNPKLDRAYIEAWLDQLAEVVEKPLRAELAGVFDRALARRSPRRPKR